MLRNLVAPVVVATLLALLGGPIVAAEPEFSRKEVIYGARTAWH